jgi:DNA-binding MarR family transcriptional regulator
VDDEFRALLQAFIRRFGLLSPDRTPCGKDLAPGDAHALMILLGAGAAGEPQARLARQLGVDKSTASRLVARLLAAGRAERAPASGDGREKPVRLTARGARLAREIDRASADRFAALLASVPRARRPGVVSALRDVVAALDEMKALDLESAA